MRTQPKIAAPTVTVKQSEEVITQVREYQLITPLFGGGVTPSGADPVTVIRSSSIRGHLRFWWRACRGGQFHDLAAMKKAEDAIWGKAYKKGDKPIPQEQTIQITVEGGKFSTSLAPYDRTQRPRIDIPLYAAFPLQLSDADARAGKPQKEIKDQVLFKLIITFPKAQKEEINAALWAWETFGGIGARTRRGFGSLRCVKIEEDNRVIPVNLPSPSQKEVEQWIQLQIKEHVVDGTWPTHIPHLTRQPKQGVHFKLINGVNNNPIVIWNGLINALKNFRQIRNVSKKPGARHPGRSLWPEPSAIRNLIRQSHPGHTSSIPNPAINKFPRAAFGLPIIFQFKDRNQRSLNDPNSDPRKTVLQINGYERFASPLILKAMPCQGHSSIGLAFILEGTRIGQKQLLLETQEGQKQQWNVNAALDNQEKITLTHANHSSQTIIDKQTDILEAFLKYL